MPSPIEWRVTEQRQVEDNGTDDSELPEVNSEAATAEESWLELIS